MAVVVDVVDDDDIDGKKYENAHGAYIVTTVGNNTYSHRFSPNGSQWGAYSYQGVPFSLCWATEKPNMQSLSQDP